MMSDPDRRSVLFKDELANFEVSKIIVQAKKKTFVRLDIEATAYRLIEGIRSPDHASSHEIDAIH